MRFGGRRWRTIIPLSNGHPKARWQAPNAPTSAPPVLAAYEAPAIDPAIDDALRAYIAKRMEELPDTDY